jgi:hypothetical protein
MYVAAEGSNPGSTVRGNLTRNETILEGRKQPQGHKE